MFSNVNYILSSCSPHDFSLPFQVAKQVNTAVTFSYWEIGKLLTELKIDSKYGDRYVKIIKRIKNPVCRR